jgi:hypothetical protein
VHPARSRPRIVFTSGRTSPPRSSAALPGTSPACATIFHLPSPARRRRNPEAEPVPAPTGRLAERRCEHHALVHDLLAQGMAIRQIASHLGWGRHPVQRYARAQTLGEMVIGRRRPVSSLDPHKTHLVAGYTGCRGCRGAIQALHREIAA